MQNINNGFIRLWWQLSIRRRYQFITLLALILLGSLIEMVSIGAVLPFISVLISPGDISHYPFLKSFFLKSNVLSVIDVKLALSLSFGFLVVFSSFIRIFILWISTKFSFKVGVELSEDIFRKTLYQPYSKHISRNSSEVINGISKVNEVIFYILIPFQNLIVAVFLSLSILIALSIYTPTFSLIVFFLVGLFYVFITIIMKRRLATNSYFISKDSTRVLKIQQEALGGIREILIDGLQEVFCNTFKQADSSRRIAQGSNQFISMFPRYLVEALAMLAVIGIAFTVSSDPINSSNTFPLLGALAIGMQRLLPSLHQIYTSWASINGAKASLIDVISLLDQKSSASTRAPSPLKKFEEVISLKNISFRYSDSSTYIFKDFNLNIKKGDRIGLVGKTGSGKSTLIDLIMGLLDPTDGAVEVDGYVLTNENKEYWYKQIAHVPQTIFLLDASIAENIAFGIRNDLINKELVIKAAKQAQISEVIDSWPLGYDTVIGERGIKLSGGQRQRIGIARALYKEAKVLIFDESTSALDSETESAVMDAIDNLSHDLTIIIIAHRISTLKNCSYQVQI